MLVLYIRLHQTLFWTSEKAFSLGEFVAQWGAHAQSPRFIFQYPISGGKYPFVVLQYWMLPELFEVLIIFLFSVSGAISISHIHFPIKCFLSLDVWFVKVCEHVCVDEFHL